MQLKYLVTICLMILLLSGCKKVDFPDSKLDIELFVQGKINGQAYNIQAETNFFSPYNFFNGYNPDLGRSFFASEITSPNPAAQDPTSIGFHIINDDFFGDLNTLLNNSTRSIQHNITNYKSSVVITSNIFVNFAYDVKWKLENGQQLVGFDAEIENYDPDTLQVEMIVDDSQGRLIGSIQKSFINVNSSPVALPLARMFNNFTSVYPFQTFSTNIETIFSFLDFSKFKFVWNYNDTGLSQNTIDLTDKNLPLKFGQELFFGTEKMSSYFIGKDYLNFNSTGDIFIDNTITPKISLSGMYDTEITMSKGGKFYSSLVLPQPSWASIKLLSHSVSSSQIFFYHKVSLEYNCRLYNTKNPDDFIDLTEGKCAIPFQQN